MANDGGLLATLVQWMADQLAALKYGVGNKLVFKTADIWKHQVSAADGGAEGFLKYAPFAFVGYKDASSAREGGDLRQIPTLTVFIGVESKEDGVAAWGDASHIGTSKIRDLVIALFDKVRPADSGFTCDEFYYISDFEVIDSPKRHGIEIQFEVSQLNT